MLGEGAIPRSGCRAAGASREKLPGPGRHSEGDQAGLSRGAYFAGYGGTGLAFTRNDGVFTISGLTAGNLRLTVIADGFGSGEVDRVEAQSLGRLKPADDLTIKLGLGHAVRVRVFQKEASWSQAPG